MDDTTEFIAHSRINVWIYGHSHTNIDTETGSGKALLKEVILRSPYDGAKDYFYISDVDDPDYLASLIKATIPVLPKPKVKKNPMR